jgi:phosphomannomutase
MVELKTSDNVLENELFKSVYDKTPDYVKNLNLMDFSQDGEFSFVLKKEHLAPYDKDANPEGLNLEDWFANYAKEAKVSTAGIRGPQNILFPQDTRFPINLVGIVLATLAKALVAKEKYADKRIIKVAGCEVRYNSQLFLDAIARIQAANGIETLVPVGKKTIPIWLASFLAFKLDLLGGEYITSSHGISVKNATKDLNSQGSQYLPEESMEFVDKIQKIFDEVNKNGSYEIKISAKDNPLINESVMKSVDDGVDLYVEYLKSGVAKDVNLSLIKNFKSKIVIENVGGSAYRTLSRVLKKLDIEDKFVWFNTEEDPFFHSIGKYDVTPKGEKAFYDYSVDATVLAKKADGTKFFPVIDTLHYDEKLKQYPIGTVVLITDPDHDRLTITQTESSDRIPELKSLGIDYIDFGDGRVLTVFTANQAFLMLMDFWAKQLKVQGLWENHPRFMIKTTASALSWDEWAKNNGVKVVNVPVGFKEIANIMKKVELKLKNNPNDNVVVDDVFGNSIDLGINPRLLFGGEESGGMIMGTEELIKSQHGRCAVAMREKSATEAIVVASALVSKLAESGIYLSQYLKEVFSDNNIIGKFDTRVDIAYYNESEPDINKLKEAKITGEALRTKNDMFYLSMAIAKRQELISLNDIKTVLNDNFNKDGLSFDNLKSIKFVGDGTYLEFDDKYIEIRPSGTDAKTKAYGGGLDKSEIEKYATVLGNYSGDRTKKHLELIPEKAYENCKQDAMDYYLAFVDKDANNEPFVVPEYDF